MFYNAGVFNDAEWKAERERLRKKLYAQRQNRLQQVKKRMENSLSEQQRLQEERKKFMDFLERNGKEMSMRAKHKGGDEATTYDCGLSEQIDGTPWRNQPADLANLNILDSDIKSVFERLVARFVRHGFSLNAAEKFVFEMGRDARLRMNDELQRQAEFLTASKPVDDDADAVF